jgi:tetratricopeptide (TPR) repeat protein
MKAEREAVFNWLVAADHQPVHSYRPDSETVRESCLEDIDGCDLYVLILGHRYGLQPEDGNPGKLSITHLEYRRAAGKPRVALLRTSIPDIGLSDIGNPELLARVTAFRGEVQREVRPAEFRNVAELVQALSTGIQSEFQKLQKSASRVMPDDPAVMQIIATLARQIEAKDSEIAALRNHNAELQTQLQNAVARTLSSAASPSASEAQVAAAEALKMGDTRLAEALMRDEEQAAMEKAGVPETTVSEEIATRQRAAELAREQGALAFTRDARAALTAYQRAAEHDPEDIWTQFYIGDLQLVLGDSAAAHRSFVSAMHVAGERVAARPDSETALRDLSVSHNKIGDVLRAQGDLAGALAAYRQSLKIAEALSARDAANTQWQRDLIVSYVKLSEVTGDKAYVSQALDIALAMQERGALAPRDAWMIDELRKRAGRSQPQ